MDNLRERFGQMPKKKMIIGGIVLVVALILLWAILQSQKGDMETKETAAPVIYDYNTEELNLAMQVREYLAEHVELTEAESGRSDWIVRYKDK